MSFDIEHVARQAKHASGLVANISNAQRKALLLLISDNLRAAAADILQANEQDLALAKQQQLPAAMAERLSLSPARIGNMADAVAQIAIQPDFLGSIDNLSYLPSGIQVGKMRIPLGVIAMIYESRPNVTIDAAVLCLKAGNSVILRGGKEAQHSNIALAKVLQQSLAQMGLPEAAVTVIPVSDRQVMTQMLTLSDDIDLVIPRGGEGLIEYVTKHSQIPVIQHFKGVCHLYVDKLADLDKALAILDNGKTQRTGVCNALETLLVHKDVAASFLPMVAKLFAEKHVKVHACGHSLPYFSERDAAQAGADTSSVATAELASEADWQAEYLALEIALKIVDDANAGFAHIQAYSSGHTEVIVTEDLSLSQRFLREINSSVVMLNASSRFSDGGELGLGAEIGISTSKLHAYGPMGAESLTTQKFIVIGNGNIRADA